jgi:hypothetical protein
MTKQTLAASQKRQFAIPMGAGLVFGVALGAAIRNVALGLALGIVMGGVGALWRAKHTTPTQPPTENHHL